MRSGGGKAKGASFERAVCKALSQWLSNGTNDDLLWRSAMSGGRSTVAFKAGKRLSAQAGDVSSIHRISHPFTETFYIECKHYRTLNFEGFIKGKGNLVAFWQIASREANQYEKIPMLIGRQNNHPQIVCLSHEGLKVMKLRPKVSVFDFDLHIVLWDDFLKSDPRVTRRVRL